MTQIERIEAVGHKRGRVLVYLADGACLKITEQELLDLAAANSVRNGSVTRLVRPDGTGPWKLHTFNSVLHLQDGGAPVTEHAGETDDIHPR